MNITFNKSDLTAKEARNILVNIMADAKHGGFMRINGFKSKGGHGEVQNTTYQKGINYGEAIKRSLAMLDAIESDTEYEATIKRGTWNDAEGLENPTGRKSKVFTNPLTVTETYRKGDAEMIEALGKVRKSLTAPERPTKKYEKLGNGIYQDEDGTLFVHDLRLISKKVVVKGDYPFKASKAISALTNAIKKDMPVSKYRMFRMDADFTNMALGGIEIAPQLASTNHAKTEQEKEHSAQPATVLA